MFAPDELGRTPTVKSLVTSEYRPMAAYSWEPKKAGRSSLRGRSRSITQVADGVTLRSLEALRSSRSKRETPAVALVQSH